MLNSKYLPYGLGAIALIACTAISFLSHQFVYGEGHATRPILLFLGLYAVAWSGFAAAMWIVYRGSRPTAIGILLIAIAMRLVFIPSNPIQENDGYRYILDGAVLAAGANPFAHSPDDMRDRAPLTVWKDVHGDPLAAETYSRISYKHIPTIYPPVAQFTFAIGHTIAPWSYLGQRIAFMCWDIAALAVIIIVLKSMGQPVAWSILYAWNPLIIKEIANSAHSDAAAAFFFVAMIGALVLLSKRSSDRWALLAGVCFAGAVLARLYPLMLAPVCAAVVFKLAGFRGLISFGAAAASAIGIAYLPFLTVPIDQLFEGLRVYGEHWRRNEGAFTLFQIMTTQPRVAASVATAIVGMAAAIWYWRGSPTMDRAVLALQAVLLAWILVAPAVFPWYAVGIIAISAFRPTLWAVVMSGSLAAYYLLFLYSYRDMPEVWATWTKAIEHGLIWLAILAPALFSYSRRLLPASATAETATTASGRARPSSAAGDEG